MRELFIHIKRKVRKMTEEIKTIEEESMDTMEDCDQNEGSNIDLAKVGIGVAAFVGRLAAYKYAVKPGINWVKNKIKNKRDGYTEVVSADGDSMEDQTVIIDE